MALILNLETSTQVCSVAVGKDGSCIAVEQNLEKNSHAANLTILIEKALKTAGMDATGLDAVAVSMGPGSYTGLRIGVSTAKGMAYASGIPLIAVPTLQALALGAVERFDSGTSGCGGKPDLFCPMIDARRLEVYAAFYDADNKPVREVRAEIIDQDSYRDVLDGQKVVFFGNGSAKCRNLIRHRNACFLDGLDASAVYMAPISERLHADRIFEDTAYFEPYYFKDFIPTTPKDKMDRR